ncbi:hypothetical protein CDD83_8074 [Cordyceps sp. RAO-2017]|nr:hypothetical protein CDD83_8074 [Cordyceps sp. RAO-2017]
MDTARYKEVQAGRRVDRQTRTRPARLATDDGDDDDDDDNGDDDDDDDDDDDVSPAGRRHCPKLLPRFVYLLPHIRLAAAQPKCRQSEVGRRMRTRCRFAQPAPALAVDATDALLSSGRASPETAKRHRAACFASASGPPPARPCKRALPSLARFQEAAAAARQSTPNHLFRAVARSTQLAALVARHYRRPKSTLSHPALALARSQSRDTIHPRLSPTVHTHAKQARPVSHGAAPADAAAALTPAGLSLGEHDPFPAGEPERAAVGTPRSQQASHRVERPARCQSETPFRPPPSSQRRRHAIPKAAERAGSSMCRARQPLPPPAPPSPSRSSPSTAASPSGRQPACGCSDNARGAVAQATIPLAVRRCWLWMSQSDVVEVASHSWEYTGPSNSDLSAISSMSHRGRRSRAWSALAAVGGEEAWISRRLAPCCRPLTAVHTLLTLLTMVAYGCLRKPRLPGPGVTSRHHQAQNGQLRMRRQSEEEENVFL